MSKVIILAFVVVCAAVVFGGKVGTGNCGEDATWYLFSNGLLVVDGSGTVSKCNLTEEQKHKVKSIIIGDDITKIAGKAFFKYYDNMETLTLGKSVETIGELAFSCCDWDTPILYHYKLTSLTIPNSVTYIGGGAFLGNSIESLTLGESVYHIHFMAFSHNYLTSVTLPKSLKSVAGFDHNKLKSLTLPNSVEEIGNDGFAYNEIESLDLGSVKDMYMCAFENNKLKSLTIPNSVEMIATESFARNNLTTVTIPESVKEIYFFAFGDNPELQHVAYLGYNDLHESIFSGSPKLTQICVPYGYSSDSFCGVKVVKDSSPLSRCGITKY